jgi:putative intracellular protease/amidase
VKIGIVVFDDFTDIDVFLPWDLLNRVQRPDWDVRLIGDAPQHRSRTGIVVPMHEGLDWAEACDAILFASGPGSRRKVHDEAYLRSFRLDPDKQLIGAICSGALILAALGLLTGKRATTHPSVRSLLAAYPVEIVDAPFVRAGNVATAGGCLASQLLAGFIIETLLGPAERDAVLASIQPVGRTSEFAARTGAAPIESTAAPVRGSCLCGGVAFEARPPFLRAGHCHCSRCRKHSGASGCLQARVNREQFRLLRGEELLRVYGRGEGAVKAFCSVCGSSLFGGQWPDGSEISIRMGAFDDDPQIRLQFHTYVDSRAPWDEITDELPRYPARWIRS